MPKKVVIILPFIILISLIFLSGCIIPKNRVGINESVGTSNILQKNKQEINLFYFYKRDCDVCTETSNFLNNLVNKNYPNYNIIINKFELTEDDNTVLLYYLLDKLKFKLNELNIPILLIGTDVLIGKNDIENGIVDRLNSNISSASNGGSIEKLITDFRNSSDKNYVPNTNFFNIPTIVLSSLIDSINPCAIAVILFLITTLVLTRNKREVIIYGSIYIITIFIVYLSLGISFIYLIKSINIPYYFYIFIGSVLIVLGSISIKDYFRFGQGVSLGLPNKIKTVVENNIHKATILSMILLGVVIAFFEATCSGAIYFGVLSVIAKEGINFKLFSLAILYNLIFVLPLVIILIVFYFGFSLKKINKLLIQKRKRLYRLVSGIVLILLGIYLILRFVIFRIK